MQMVSFLNYNASFLENHETFTHTALKFILTFYRFHARVWCQGLFLCKFYPHSNQACSGSAISLTLFQCIQRCFLCAITAWRGQVAKSTQQLTQKPSLSQTIQAFHGELDNWDGRESRYVCFLRHVIFVRIPEIEVIRLIEPKHVKSIGQNRH